MKIYQAIAVLTACFLPLVALAQHKIEPVRIGIHGLPHSHVHGLLGRENKGDIQLVGIAEPNRELAERYAERYGIDASLLFEDLPTMLAEAQPEAVPAFNSIYGHIETVRACAPLGIHVMVEKPLTYPGTQVIIQASWNWPFNRKDMEVYGQTGKIYQQNKHEMQAHLAGENSEVSKNLPERTFPHNDPFGYLAAVLQGRINPPDNNLSSLENNQIVVEILAAAIQSAQTGETINMSDF